MLCASPTRPISAASWRIGWVAEAAAVTWMRSGAQAINGTGAAATRRPGVSITPRSAPVFFACKRFRRIGKLAGNA